MVDLAAALLAFYVAAFLRANLTIAGQVPTGLEIHSGVYRAIPFVWVIGAVGLGSYRSKRKIDQRTELALLCANALINVAAVFGVSVLLMPVVPRLMYGFFLVLLISLLFLFRSALRLFAASPFQPRLIEALRDGWNGLKGLDKVLYQRRADLITIGVVSLFWVGLNYLAGFIYSPDSVEYVTMAAKFRYAGDAAFLPYWPPLLPMLIAFFSFLVSYPANAGMALVSLSTFAVLLVYAFIVRRILRSSLLTLVVVTTMAGTGIFLNVATTVWSEMLFLLFILLGLWFVLVYSRSASQRHVFLALACAGLAACTRYIGSIQLASTTLLIIWLSWRAGRKIPFASLLIGNSFFALILTYLSLRNNALYGAGWFDIWMGPRADPVRTLPGNLETVGRILSADLGWALLVLIAIGLIYSISRIRIGLEIEGLLISVPAVYLVALIYSSSIYAPVLLDSRLLFPAYASLIVFSIWGGVQVFQRALEDRNQFIRYFVPLLVVFLIAFSFADNSRWFVNHIGETLRHAGEPDLHFDDGYGLSSTAEGLARTMESSLEGNDHLNIFVLVTPETNGRIFLLQAEPYRSLHPISIAFSRFQGQDYSVDVKTEAGRHKQIDYWFLSASDNLYTNAPQDPSVLIPQIEQRLVAAPGDNLVLFLLNDENEAVWQLVLGELSQQYDVELIGAPPYAAAFFESR